MRLAETFGRHARESALLAIIAGGKPGTHVSSCALCQARLDALRGWVDTTAADAGAVADRVFTSDRLAAQKQQVLARLEALGRSARVIAFPAGTSSPVYSRTRDVMRWAAAAAIGGIIVGLASGRLLDPHDTAPTVATANTPAPTVTADADELDEAALLDAAYDRVSIDELQTIDDITPRAREVVLASLPASGR